ncbi:monooxygenase [Fusarium bulbicola]|nr:monooxygenase [Fusarium bulbicola]
MLSYQYKHGDTPLEQFMDLKIYEKNDDIGGTWLVNKYPGVACDVPAHIYTFPFEPNPSWSQFYATGSEIWRYIKKTSDKYRLHEPVILNTERLEIQQGHSRDITRDEADIIINATGFLSKWTWPTIAGLDKFKGKLVHTAAWDTNLNWSSKRVAIIGNGSSAMQVLPQMQPTADKIAFKDNKEMFFQLRRSIEHSTNKLFRVSVKDSPEQRYAFLDFKAKMEAVLNHDPDLYARLIPTFQVGKSAAGNCLPEVVKKGIRSLTKIEEFDIIVCATGFNVSFVPGFKVVGQNGVSLAELQKDAPEAYFRVFAANMPNFFTVNSPNTPLAHGSLLAVMSFTVNYIARWIRKISTQNIKSWFKKGKADGRVTAMYTGSVIHYKEILDEFRTEDFVFKYTSKNRFQFMGNGLTFRETNDGDLAWYMRK